MALETQTKTVVGQFDYSDEDVNKGVVEFLRQMGRWSYRRRQMPQQALTN